MRRGVSRSGHYRHHQPFSEWGEAFPNASCVVALVDRLVHNAGIVAIDGDSWRRKEAEERQKIRRGEPRRRRARQARRPGPRGTVGSVTVDGLHPWDRRVLAEALRGYPLEDVARSLGYPVPPPCGTPPASGPLRPAGECSKYPHFQAVANIR